MATPEYGKEEAEQDQRFPSGEWHGFFLQPSFFAGRIKMSLCLTFLNGRVSGEGQDLAGKFVLRGKYIIENGEVILHKRYLSAHDVFYRGFAEATGKGIWGVWEIPQFDRGGWHLWPKGQSSDNERAACADTDEPQGVVVVENEPLPAAPPIIAPYQVQAASCGLRSCNLAKMASDLRS